MSARLSAIIGLLRRVKVAYLLILALHGYLLVAAISQRSYLTDDSIQYLTLARNMAEEGVFSQSFGAPYSPDTQRPPGYPLFIVVLGQDPVTVVVVQHLLLFVAAWLVHGLLRRAYSPRAGRIGAVIFLLQPYPVLFAGLVLSETLFMVLLLAWLHAFLRYWRENGVKWLALSLVWLCAATMVRPVAVPLLAVMGIAAIIKAWTRRTELIPALTLVLAVPMLVLGPWMWRNHRLTDRWMLSSMGPMNMVHGRLGGLEAQRLGLPADEHNLYMAGDSIAATQVGWAELKWYPDDKQTHETELLREGMTGMTVGYFLAHPLDAAWFEVRSLWAMLKGLGFGWAKAQTHSGVAAYGLAALQLVLNLFNFVGVLLALRRRRHWRGGEGVLVWTVAIVLLVSASAWADGRYRAVVDPLMTCLGAFVVWSVEQEAKARGAGQGNT